MAVDSTFGPLLRRFRSRSALSQAQLADRARISVEAVGALERGSRRAPYRETVALLADALLLEDDDRKLLEAAAAQGRARPLRRSADAEAPVRAKAQLPLQTTSFIGRAAELASIAALLEQNRLVTITGSGGVGKTRVALEVAARFSSDIRADIRFVDLSPVRDGRFLVGAIASQLRPGSGETALSLEEFVASLQPSATLLILDNCEHLVADVALLVAAALRSCPQISFLATSRERLAIHGEAVYRLPSLEIPDRRPLDMQQARAYAALELFIERSAMADTFIDRHPEALERIVAICRKLDGIPLAIELAAARVSTLGLENVHARLDRGMPVAGGARMLPARQQTMFSAIAWSYELLDATEKLVLQRASVFADGFTLPAAEAVCSGEGIEPDAVADLLSSLVDKSLVNVRFSGDRTRYWILDSVRSFASAALAAAGQSENLSLRHAQWLAAFADWIDTVRAERSEQWLRAETAPELENARTALSWALKAGTKDTARLAGRIVGGLRTVWLRSGRPAECTQWAQAALAELDEEGDLPIVARLLRALVQSAAPSEQLLWIERAMDAFERLGDRTGYALLLCHLALVNCKRGLLDEAEAQCSRAADIFEDGPRSMPYTVFLDYRWRIHNTRGRYDEALADIAAGTAIVRSFGEIDPYRWVYCRALVEFAKGRRTEAIETLEAMLERAASDEEAYGHHIVMVYQGLAEFYLRTGDVQACVRAAREVLSHHASWQALDEALAMSMHRAAIAAALLRQPGVAARLLMAIETQYDDLTANGWQMRDFPFLPVDVRTLVLDELALLRAHPVSLPLGALIPEALRTLADE